MPLESGPINLWAKPSETMGMWEQIDTMDRSSIGYQSMVRIASWVLFWPRTLFVMVGHILRICGARIKNEAYTGLPKACNLLVVV